MQQARIAWPPLTRGLKILLICYAAIFPITLFAGTLKIQQFLGETFYLSNEGLIGNLYLWQPLTYQLFHDNFMHLLFNCMVLYSFGGEVERRWKGPFHFIAFVILCGFGGAALVVLSQFLFPGQVGPGGFSIIKTLGASGGIYGVVAAFCLFNWNRPMSLMFIPGRIKAKWLLPLFVGFDVIMTLVGSAPISLAGHIGGLIMGLLVVTGFYKPNSIIDRIRLWRARRRLRMLRGGHPLDRDDDKPRYMN